jgi:hypothetical protein
MSIEMGRDDERAPSDEQLNAIRRGFVTGTRLANKSATAPLLSSEDGLVRELD